jgi:LysM repeat protein
MRVLLTIIFAFTFLLARAQTPQDIAAYIERYKAVAIEEMKTYGIPASITLAQGIHESASGFSALAKNANNHFGIKCHDGWTGKTYKHDDDTPQECFRVYNSAEESFRDHSEFLKTRSRYANLFALDPADYHGWARGLKADGYATNPKYPDILIKLIDDYNLTQYDKPEGQIIVAQNQTKDTVEIQVIKQSLAQSSPPPARVMPVVVKTNSQKVDASKHTAQTPATKQSPAKSSPPPIHVTEAEVKTNSPELDLSKYTFEEKTVNGTLAVVYKKDFPLAAIAQTYSINMQQLYSYNDMTANTKLKDNDLVYVETKKAESFYYQYEVSAGETMRDVSQKFAVQLSELVKRNGVAPGYEPVGGEMIVLRGKREFPLKVRATAKTANPTKTSIENSPTDSRVHKVGTKETLFSISKQYNIPLDTLKRINGLKDKDIKIGQTLIVSL